MTKKINVKNLITDSICKEWIAYNTTQDMDQPAEWFEEKQEFWDKNKEHLEANGYEYESNISVALDQIKILKENNMEGCLLIVKIGSDTRPATPSDIHIAHKMIEETVKGVLGVRIIVTHHDFSIERVELPQLRSLQSAVLASVDPEESVNPIRCIEL